MAVQVGAGGDKLEWMIQEPWHWVSRQSRREEEEVVEEESSSLATERRRQARTAMCSRLDLEGRVAASRKKARQVASRGRWRGIGREE